MPTYKQIYQLQLPVFKQGDDLNGCLTSAKQDQGLALKLQAETYRRAAEICDVLSALAASGELDIIQADTHYIGVTGDEEALKPYVADGILVAEETDDSDTDDQDHPIPTDEDRRNYNFAPEKSPFFEHPETFLNIGDKVKAKFRIFDLPSGHEDDWGPVAAEAGEEGTVVHVETDYWPTVRFDNTGRASEVTDFEVEPLT